MKTCDIIVIGGGIAGIGCAAMLAGRARVAVLEQEPHPGYHASGRSAAIFIPSYGGPEIRALTAASEAYLDTPPPELETESLLKPRGEMLLAGEGEQARLTALMAEMPMLEELSVADARRLVPILEPGWIRGACIDRGARDIDADRLLQRWAGICRKQGGTVATGEAAAAIRRNGGAWTVTTRTQTWQAPVLVNAAGAWADETAELAGIGRLGLTPCRRSAALLPAPGGQAVDAWPLFGSVAENWYAKPVSGKLMVSPADEDPVDPHDAYADDMVLAGGLHRYEQSVTFPVTRVEHSWAGLRTFAPDRVPVAGFDPRAEGFFWLAGQGGYGIQTAPALSQLASDLVLGGDSPTLGKLASRLAPERLLRR